MKIFSYFLLLLAAKSIAAPQGLVVSNGNVTLHETSQSLIITASDQAILNWNEFSVDANEHVQFIQPNVDALAINRVVAPNPTEILGSLTANGKIILVNPNGILVGREAQIDTGSWIASTLDLNSKLYLDHGEFNFSGSSEMDLINEGSISANSGPLFLVGKKVYNKGTLVAFGTIAGTIGTNAFKLAKGQIYVQTKSPSKESQDPFTHTFSIVEGNITNPGGTIFVLGDTIGVSKGVSLDVSHTHKPGEVYIGGDYQGKNPNLTNASWTFVEKGAFIRADATDSGDGGKIILWADQRTEFFGSVSAQGGPNMGDGGFLEISGKNSLDFQGQVSTKAPFGKTGTLLLDPPNITIQVAGTTTGSFSGCIPPNTYTPAIAADILTVNSLTGGGGALLSCDVVVNAASGDITVTGALAWSSGNSLTLNAAGNINSSVNIQESNAAFTAGNRVILNAGGNINITNGSVGSQNGGTSATCLGDLVVGGITSATPQLGFRSSVPCEGGISVSCNNLSLIGPGASHIGHGPMFNGGGAGLSTSATAVININAAGNILVENGSGLSRAGKIGHGATSLAFGDDLNGNISITCGDSLSMNGIADASNTALCIIGHGPLTNGGMAANFISIDGDISIEIANDLSMDGRVRGTQIGHGSTFTNTRCQSLSGDIRICCGGGATLLGAAGIVHRCTVNPALSTTSGDFDISIGGDLFMSSTFGVGASNCIIGANFPSTRILSGTYNLSVCGGVTFSAPNAIGLLGLGYASSDATSDTRSNIIIGGNFIGTNLNSPTRIISQGDLNLAVGGDIILSMAAGNVDGFISSGLTSGAGAVPATTRVYVGGDILLTSNGTSVMSIGVAPLTFNSATNIDVRAGGDIQWANTYAAGLPGSIGIQAGYSFSAGELWDGSGTELTSVASQAITPTFNLGCGACAQFTTSPQTTASCGAFTIQGSGGPTGPVNFTTGAGQPLTLTSLCSSCGGGLSTISIGSTAGNDVQFGGAPGNVGPLNLGAFYAVDINQNITSTGSIDVSACHDLNLNPSFAITSTGAGSPITLISDVDNSGMGNLNLNGGNITSNNGPICLLAGPGTFGCSSDNCETRSIGLIPGSLASINQTSGQISSGSAATILVASGDILIDGATPSIITTSGEIALTAGRNVTINKDLLSASGAITSFAGENTELNDALVTTDGEIRMVTGNDFSLNGASTIASTGSSVTLVADNQFPDQPFIGPGAFSMSCTATITSGGGEPIRIFTALQGSNSICASATMNGFQVSEPQFGFPGPLFEDTLYEMWCTYFACPSPYPFPGLGLPFTVFYKNCLQKVTEEAMLVLDEFLVDLHPYNEFPGWVELFWIEYREWLSLQDEPYMIRRRNLNFNNHPKSYTVLTPDILLPIKRMQLF